MEALLQRGLEDLKRRPGDAQLLLDTAGQGLDAGKPQVAANLLRRLVRLQPRLGIAHFTLGRALGEMGDWHGAADAFTEALSLDPANGGCMARLAEALERISRPEEAHLMARHAMAQPALAKPTLVLLGDVFQKLGDLEGARQALLKALESEPDGWTHSRLARLLGLMKERSTALEHHRRAVELAPEDPVCLAGLGSACIDMGDAERGAPLMEKASLLDPSDPGAATALIFAGSADPALDPETYHRSCAGWIERSYPPRSPMFSPRHDRTPHRKLRIAYLSPDFRTHAMMHWIAPLLEARNREGFEVFCFAECLAEDAMTEHFRSLADRWIPTTGKAPEEFARKIAALGVDILVDLAGATAGNRLDVLALKPAPVQAAMLGFDRSTGLKAMDWRITTALADPVGEADRWSSEGIWRLDTSFAYRPLADAPDVAELPALRNGYVTFGFPGNPARVGRTFLEAAVRLLEAVPHSRLLLLCREGEDEAHKAFKRDFLVQAGLDPERLIFRPRVLPESRFLEYYHEVDITLNSFPADGGTTICESLWMGVPVLVLDRPEALRHTGRALVTYAGLGEGWVATDVPAWIDLAQRWSSDRMALSELRAGLRERLAASPVCDESRAVRAVEEAYRGMWTKWCGTFS